MTRTQLLDARRNIRKELVAYLSIVIIGLLATVSYLSVTYAAETLRRDAMSFFNTYGLWDLELGSTLLLDGEDLAAVRALPGVAAAEPVRQADTRLCTEAGESELSILNLPEAISRPRLLEGRLPERAGECAVEKELAARCGLAVGQSISPERAADSNVDPLREWRFEITGIFQTPDHITYMIPVTPYILVTADSFDDDALQGAFMKLRVRLEDMPADRFSDAYWQALAPAEEALSAMAPARAGARAAAMRESVQRQIDEAAGKLAEGRQKLEDGQRELDEKRGMLADARRRLDEGWAALHEAEAKLSEAKQQLDRGGTALAEAEYQLAEVPGYLYAAMELLNRVEERTGPVSLPGELGGMRGQLTDGLRQYSQGRMDWYAMGEQYLDAVESYKQNLRALEDGERQYLDGEAALAEAERELADGERKLTDGERELENAGALRDGVGEGRWVVLSDRGNPGFIYARENANKLDSLSMSFSMIFLVVGALVIYATVGRMVEQQRKTIGAAKALGLYNREVFAKYLYFACTAAALGVGLGVLLAWLPLQRLILASYEKLLCYGQGTRSFLPLKTSLVAAGALVLPTAAVYLGCGQLLRQSAIRLLQGAAPQSGRKKAHRSVKRGLLPRLIARNMRTDWSRVLVTTVSIAGGCTLMVIGFTLRYGISGVPDRQFGGILTYGAEVFFDPGQNPGAAEEIEALLAENGLENIEVYKAAGVYEEGGSLSALTYIAAPPGSLEGYFALKSLDGSRTLDLPESGALVPRRFSEHYGLTEGDSVTVYDGGMEARPLKIAGVFENYYGQLFFLTPESYAGVFGAPPANNCFFVKTGDMSPGELEERLADVAGLLRVNDAAAERSMIGQFTAALNLVVWLMLFIAGLMACFIVANFTLTYLQRKTRELTIMRVNGFSVGECVRYAAVDLAVTTVLGTTLGLAAGGCLGHAILRTTETPYIQMIRDQVPQCYAYSALITIGFSLLTNSLALRRIRSLKLSNIG